MLYIRLDCKISKYHRLITIYGSIHEENKLWIVEVIYNSSPEPLIPEFA